MRGLVDPRGGAVAVVPRFGGALNVNVHIHDLVLDGVFARAENGCLTFHATPNQREADGGRANAAGSCARPTRSGVRTPAATRA